jgi:probable DNA metabolism protein
MFVDEIHTVLTDKVSADRVWKGLYAKLDRRTRNMVMHVWLSEEDGNDMLLMRYMRKVFDSSQSIVSNFTDSDVLAVHKLAMQVAHEGEYVRQFVRLQKASDGSYFGAVAPKYNALPLAVDYFQDRFADQRWLVYDTRRHYGYYYDLETVREVTLEDDRHLLEGKFGDDIIAADEKMFQQAWCGYHKALTIKERSNPRLQRQHMPRRFWKYLTEKQ